MPKINQSAIRSLPVPVPPLAEQKRIVAKVGELMALVDELETNLTASQSTASKLMDAIWRDNRTGLTMTTRTLSTAPHRVR